MDFNAIKNYSREVYDTLIELITTPGPSSSCARVSGRSEKFVKDFPMTKKIREIVEGFEKSGNICLVEDHGNIVLVGGPDSNNPDRDEIRDIPIALGAHLDEVTYLISRRWDGDYRVLFPLCSPPTRAFHPTYHAFLHEEAQILGLRNGELTTVGYGKFHAKPLIEIGRDGEVRMEDWSYLLEVEKELERVLPGDVVIQNYVRHKEYGGPDTVVEAKALDDRVGTVAVLYAFRFLSQRMPIKAILSGDEEGVPRDISWARLIMPTYRRFCKNDVITILCDGINGADITEYPKEEGKFLPDALLLPYTAEGKGGGDYRLFSLIREKVIPICRKNSFGVRAITDYASRSFDPKIMNEYPLITFIDWSNGLIKNHLFRCHYHEEVLFRQVLNIIGCLFWSSMFLYQNRQHINL